MQARLTSQRGIFYFIFVFQLLLAIVAARLWRGSTDMAPPHVTSRPPQAPTTTAEISSWASADVTLSAMAVSSDVVIPKPADRILGVEQLIASDENPFSAGGHTFATTAELIVACNGPFESLGAPFRSPNAPFPHGSDLFLEFGSPIIAAEDAFAAAEALVPPLAVALVPVVGLAPPPTQSTLQPEVALPLASTTPIPLLPDPETEIASEPAQPPSSSPASTDQGQASAPSPWSAPAAMMAPLQRLAAIPEHAAWAAAVRRSVGEVLQSTTLADESLARSFSTLDQLGLQEVRRDASAIAALQRQQAYAVRRRAGLWRAVHKSSQTVDQNRAYNDPTWMDERCGDMASSLDDLEASLDARQSGNAWRNVFQVPELRSLAMRCSPSDLSGQQQLAHQVLDELDAMKRFRGSDAVWALPAMIQFIECLHVWAVEPVTLSELLDAIESLELYPTELAARGLARTTQGLLASDQEAHRQIGSYLETHYRNANLRLVLSDQLINRLLPSVPSTVRPVRDSMFGAQISGQSHNTARLSFRAVPDPDAWNVRLDAQGSVSARTSARKGPVITYDQGQSEFAASKPVVVDQSGVHVGRTKVAAQGYTRLRGLETQLDKIPILGYLVRRLAREEHAKKLPRARRMFASRVAGQVRGEVDKEVHDQLEFAEKAYNQRIQQPLTDLALDPRSLQLSTTADRKLLVRYRVAADSQLGAFTARPRALADSLLSLQIHQSTLNNTVQQLGLAGRRVELSQLLLEIADKLQLADFQLPEDLPEGVLLKFATSDPLRLEFHDGRATVKVRLAELRDGRRRWRNFEARAHYVPHVRGVQVAMRRVDSVQLLGPRLSFGSQVALRGIFTKVFDKNRELPLVKPQFAEHPALAQAQLSQLEIRDGWIGVSLSDAAPATASRPATDIR